MKRSGITYTLHVPVVKDAKNLESNENKHKNIKLEKNIANNKWANGAL